VRRHLTPGDARVYAGRVPEIDTTSTYRGIELDEEYRLLHGASLLALFCVGMYAASFGPVLPFLASDVGVSLDTAGLILTALFLGSIAASATIAIALHQGDTRLLTMIGLACNIAGITLVGLAPTWPLALAGAVVLGVGDGLVVAALHILVGLTSRDVPSALNRLNLYFAFGAIAGPLWAGAVLAAGGQRAIVYGGIAALQAAALAMMAAAAGPPAAAPVPHDEEFPLPHSATAWIMGTVLFLYVGAEFGLGSWVSSYTRETAHAGVFAAAALSAGYWAALALGRIVSGVYFARGRDATALLIASVAGGGVAAGVLALSSGNIAVAAAAAFGAGLCFGPIWPATMAIGAKGGRPSSTAAIVTVGNAGGLALPWLQGKVLVGAGAAQGVAVTAALCALMLAIVVAFGSRRRAA